MKLLQILRNFFKPHSDGMQAPASKDSRDRWHLMVGPITLGELVYHSYETPWITAAFSPSPDFARFIPYFDWERDVAMNAGIDHEDGPNDPVALIEEIDAFGGIRIVDLKSNTARSALINFESDYTSATFR